MSKKWMFLTCVLSLGSVETSQAHPLDSRDIVYIDGCHVTAPASPTWPGSSNVVRVGTSGTHAAPAAPGERHRSPRRRRQESRSAWQGRPCHCRPPGWRCCSPQITSPASPMAARQAWRRGQFQHDQGNTRARSDGASQQATAAPPAPSPEQKSNNGNTVVASRSESVPPSDVERAASAPPDSVNNLATLPAVNAATDINIRTLRKQVTAAAALPAPDQKADNGALSDRSETIEPGDTNKATSAPPYDVAALEPTVSAVVNSNTRTIQAAGDCRHCHRGARDDVARCRKGLIGIAEQHRPDGCPSYHSPGNQRDIRSDRQGHCDRRQVFRIQRQGSHRNRRSGSGRNPAQRRANEGHRPVDPRRSAGSSPDFAVSRNRISRIRGI